MDTKRRAAIRNRNALAQIAHEGKMKGRAIRLAHDSEVCEKAMRRLIVARNRIYSQIEDIAKECNADLPRAYSMETMAGLAEHCKNKMKARITRMKKA